jgi:hypothetical protein
MQAELLTELEKAFAAETKTPSVAVDMTNVRLVDQDTVMFLAAYQAQGVKLLNRAAYLKLAIAGSPRRRVHEVVRSRLHTVTGGVK